MSQVLTLEFSDDVYKAIERAATPMGQKPAEWVSMKVRQQLATARKGSPNAVLKAMRKPPHVTPSDIEVLEESIATGKRGSTLFVLHSRQQSQRHTFGPQLDNAICSAKVRQGMTSVSEAQAAARELEGSTALHRWRRRA